MSSIQDFSEIRNPQQNRIQKTLRAQRATMPKFRSIFDLLDAVAELGGIFLAEEQGEARDVESR